MTRTSPTTRTLKRRARPTRRILSLWLPRAAAENALRRRRADPDLPFAVLAEERGALSVASLSEAAERCGLRLGQSAADARAVLPDLAAEMADPETRTTLSTALQRWSLRFCPWASEDRSDETPPFGPAQTASGGAPRFQSDRFRGDLSLALDVTGSAHLFGGEAALLERLVLDLSDLGFTARAALAESRGAAWALARYGDPARAPLIALPGGARAALASLPPAALRLEPKAVEGLARLGIASIEALAGLPRGAVSRRLGPGTLRRLDQAFGSEPEPIAPIRPPAPYAARLSLPEPIGRLEDLEAGLDRLLRRLCARLEREGMGARRLILDLRRVDRARLRLEAALARPGRDPAVIARLFARPLQGVDAGFGVDAMRLEAIWTEALAARQTGAETSRPHEGEALAGLLTSLGGRLGFDRLIRLAPAESHLPDRAALVLAAAHSEPNQDWAEAAARRPPRPLSVFPPEPIEPLAENEQATPGPPRRFHWRGAAHQIAAAHGPERIAPEWWLDDPAWRGGLRDYWRVETADGLRLWLFESPETTAPLAPRWFAAGRFA